MNAVLGGVGLGMIVLYIIFGIMLLIAPLMIWSNTSKTVRLLREQNLYLRILARKADPSIRLPGE